MVFCPVCGETDQVMSVRCERVARHYGYSPAELTAQTSAKPEEPVSVSSKSDS